MRIAQGGKVVVLIDRGIDRERGGFHPTSQPAARLRARWWSQTGSNRRPHACKARALPTELWPLGLHASKPADVFGQAPAGFRAVVVGPGRFELPTSRLSGVRSNQLSYGPSDTEAWRPKPHSWSSRSYRRLKLHTERRAIRGKRNEDGGIPHLLDLSGEPIELVSS